MGRLPGDVRDDRNLYVELYGHDAVKRRAFYNISAGGHKGFGGGFSHPCWMNLDVDVRWERERNFDPSRDVAYDALSMDPLPIATDSALLVQTRFAIEHLTNAAVEILFREIHRVLRLGGALRVTCPNIDLDYRAYLRRDMSYFWWHNYPPNIPSIEQAMLDHFAASLSMLHPDGAPSRISDAEFSEIIRSHSQEEALDLCVSRCPVDIQRRYRRNHINWWNEDKIFTFLKGAGFETFYRSGPRQSDYRVLRNQRHFDNLFNEVALYVEAVKTAP